MENIRLELLTFNELKFLEWKEQDPCKAKNKKKKAIFFGIKRRAPLHKKKLQRSINENGELFPLIVAELPNKEKWLIDGYGRWELENPDQMITGSTLNAASPKHYAVIIPAKDLSHVKELYLQCHSVYGAANHSDLMSLMNEKKYGEEKYGHSRYEIPGIVHPNFDLSAMTREELAKAMLESKYQII